MLHKIKLITKRVFVSPFVFIDYFIYYAFMILHKSSRYILSDVSGALCWIFGHEYQEQYFDLIKQDKEGKPIGWGNEKKIVCTFCKTIKEEKEE